MLSSSDAVQSCGDEHVRLMSCQRPIRHLSAVTDVHRPLSLSLSLYRSLSCSLCFYTSQTHTDGNTCKPPHILVRTTHTHRLPRTDSWGVTLLARSPETQRKMDRQELSVRTQEHEVGFSLQIMNHMWSVNAAPIRSDDNYLSTSQSS